MLIPCFSARYQVPNFQIMANWELWISPPGQIQCASSTLAGRRWGLMSPAASEVFPTRFAERSVCDRSASAKRRDTA
jgi:hypothetical protein